MKISTCSGGFANGLWLGQPSPPERVLQPPGVNQCSLIQSATFTVRLPPLRPCNMLD